LTAFVFAAIHPYSFFGFALIAWSAFVWAWVYEKTGSLLPAIFSHFVGNLLAISGMMLYYR
jgi:membrane protease YdiL (CAAX protease family)